MGVRGVIRKKTYVCGLCLEPFRLEGGADRCITLCEKCWDMGDAEGAQHGQSVIKHGED
jgi:hypothetical protein